MCGGCMYVHVHVCAVGSGLGALAHNGAGICVGGRAAGGARADLVAYSGRHIALFVPLLAPSVLHPQFKLWCVGGRNRSATYGHLFSSPPQVLLP